MEDIKKLKKELNKAKKDLEFYKNSDEVRRKAGINYRDEMIHLRTELQWTRRIVSRLTGFDFNKMGEQNREQAMQSQRKYMDEIEGFGS